MSFLRQVPILETLSEMELLAVADALVPEEHGDEAIICEEGQVGEKFYLIEVPTLFRPPSLLSLGRGGYLHTKRPHSYRDRRWGSGDG
jgi:hypothetical protein